MRTGKTLIKLPIPMSSLVGSRQSDKAAKCEWKTVRRLLSCRKAPNAGPPWTKRQRDTSGCYTSSMFDSISGLLASRIDSDSGDASDPQTLSLIGQLKVALLADRATGLAFLFTAKFSTFHNGVSSWKLVGLPPPCKSESALCSILDLVRLRWHFSQQFFLCESGVNLLVNLSLFFQCLFKVFILSALCNDKRGS